MKLVEVKDDTRDGERPVDKFNPARSSVRPPVAGLVLGVKPGEEEKALAGFNEEWVDILNRSSIRSGAGAAAFLAGAGAGEDLLALEAEPLLGAGELTLAAGFDGALLPNN